MHDHRVVRGSTYALPIVPPSVAEEAAEKKAQAEERGRRKLADLRQSTQAGSRADVPPVAGRLHSEVSLGRRHRRLALGRHSHLLAPLPQIQTETYMEALSDRPPELDMSVQTEAAMDRPPAPLFVPAPVRPRFSSCSPLRLERTL
jgi:Radial spoke protein 3